MLFRRKKKDSSDADAARQVQRTIPQDFSQFRVFLESHEGESYRGQVDGALVVQVESSLDTPVQCRLVDLSIQGVCVIVTLQSFPSLTEGEIVGVRIEHARDQWKVATPGLVRVISLEGGRWVRIGLEFVNPGNLFAQLENDRGAYFNRRSDPRVPVEQYDAQLRQKGVKATMIVDDISVAGLGGTLDHVQGAPLLPGKPVKIRLTLPDPEAIVEGPGEIVFKSRAGARDRIGIKFDLDEWKSGHAQSIRTMVDKYLGERFRWTG